MSVALGQANGGTFGLKTGTLLTLLAAGAFQLGFEFPALNSVILVYAFSLISLSRACSSRLAFRLGFLNGMLVFAPQFLWFWHIFGFASVCLWAILSLFTGLFVWSLWLWRERFGGKFVWLAAPMLWTGCEYFRSELYFLRFSWLSIGYVFSGHAGVLPVGAVGVYGCGFVVFLLAALAAGFGRKRALAVLVVLTGVAMALAAIPGGNRSANREERAVKVAGMQLEFPPELKVPAYLDRLIAAYPDAELLVLSEYTFDAAVPKPVRAWCREHGKFLIAGGKGLAEKPGEFYNTAFVVGPSGEVVFEQVKSVPIQFFKDGLPAPGQQVWNSPWGKIGICICYDLGYRRIVDKFARQGAQGLIVPFMDVSDWGEHQHELHSRVGPMRALEYGVPIFRVGSSGISQLIDSQGRVLERAPFPGEERMIGGSLALGARARLPLDTVLAPVYTVFAVLFLSYCGISSVFRMRTGEMRVVREGSRIAFE